MNSRLLPLHRLKSAAYLLFLFCLCNYLAHGQIQQISHELHNLPFIKDSVSLVNSLNRLGTLYRSRNADSCFHYGMKAKRLATDINYQKGQTAADHLVAYAFFKRGLYAESLELLSKILPHYQQFGDIEKMVRVYLDIIEVRNKGISDRAEIISILQKAVQTGKQLEKDSIMSSVYLSYVTRNTTLSNDSIDYYLNKSHEIANRYNDEQSLIFIRLWQTRLLMLNGQKDEALPVIKRLISEAQRIGNVTLEVNAHFLMVGYCDTNPIMALEHCYQAYEVAQKSGDRSLEIYILNNALEVAKHIGDKDEIIKVHVELEKAMTAEWENSKKFISDYVRFNAIQHENQLLSKKTKQRTVWLLLISLSASIIVFAIYLTMIHRNREAKVKIESLNNMANIQIVAMEEAKQQAVRNEQQRLALDLHDNLSSTLAGIKHQLELLIIDNPNSPLAPKLAEIGGHIGDAYAIARGKSHQWFQHAESPQETSFQNRIQTLLDTALPNSRYTKAIEIDEQALDGVVLETRIELLRIIQEAVTNTIKHAKAKAMSVLLYRDMNQLVLSIADDGRGMAPYATLNKGIGMWAIQERVRSLGGTLTINSSTSGTEISINIPLYTTDRHNNT